MTASRSVRPFYRPMRPRRRDEPHRSATPLELFFDLCFVVAVAQAASSLHHDVAEGHLGHAALEVRELPRRRRRVDVLRDVGAADGVGVALGHAPSLALPS